METTVQHPGGRTQMDWLPEQKSKNATNVTDTTNDTCKKKLEMFNGKRLHMTMAQQRGGERVKFVTAHGQNTHYTVAHWLMLTHAPRAIFLALL